jgi:hypothetical protein
MKMEAAGQNVSIISQKNGKFRWQQFFKGKAKKKQNQTLQNERNKKILTPIFGHQPINKCHDIK